MNKMATTAAQRRSYLYYNTQYSALSYSVDEFTRTGEYSLPSAQQQVNPGMECGVESIKLSIFPYISEHCEGETREGSTCASVARGIYHIFFFLRQGSFDRPNVITLHVTQAAVVIRTVPGRTFCAGELIRRGDLAAEIVTLTLLGVFN